jgi:N-acetylmuramoyl-L-alanine amidase
MRNAFVFVLGAGAVSLVTLFFSYGGGASLSLASAWVTRELQTASVFFVPSITVAQIRDDYKGSAVNIDPVTGLERQPAPSRKVRILIVPGHQPAAGGAEFRGVKEREVVVDIADALATLLSQNPRFDVMVARTKDAWSPTLQSYFDAHAYDIETFRQGQALQMADHLASGSLLPRVDQVYHETVPSMAALQLYGINKWANENAYDITLHLHINDDAERSWDRPGKYGGFAVYVPDHQFSNAVASRAVGESIAARLNAYHATSTLPKEDAGVVEDQELIATGSNNSVDDAALLIEYGYIYEPQFQKAAVVPIAVQDYAYETYLGLQDFFNDPVRGTLGTTAFPYDWSSVTAEKGEADAGIYALQAALHALGYYPPVGKSFSDCPVSGKVGGCTKRAIEAYQAAHGLESTGSLGPETRNALVHDINQSSPTPISMR